MTPNVSSLPLGRAMVIQRPGDLAFENGLALLRLAAGSDRDLRLIAREAGIADHPDAADRWAVDQTCPSWSLCARVGPSRRFEGKCMERVDYESLIIQDLLNFHNDGSLNISPWYQRRSVWSKPQKAYLINTIFERKPVPSVYIRHQIDVDLEKSFKEVELTPSSGEKR
jgi:hypothetical protein